MVFSRASVISTTVCVTDSYGGSLVSFFCAGKSSVVSETRYDDVLGM